MCAPIRKPKNPEKCASCGNEDGLKLYWHTKNPSYTVICPSGHKNTVHVGEGNILTSQIIKDNG